MTMGISRVIRYYRMGREHTTIPKVRNSRPTDLAEEPSNNVDQLTVLAHRLRIIRMSR
jgi:hypothetical protein